MKASSHPFTTAPWTSTAFAACLSAALTTAACADDAQPDEIATAMTQATEDVTYLDAPQTPGTWE